MFSLKGIKNRFLILLFTLLLIILIGSMDFKTGVELSFSLFYIIPIAFYSLYQGTNRNEILIICFTAAASWFISEYFNKEYSSVFYPIWNTFVRLVIFITIGLTLLYLKIKDKKLYKANEDLQLLNDEKNTMIGIAAHDLKNPIGAIYSLSNLLNEGDKKQIIPSEISEGLQIIETLSSNTLEVLNNLLNVSAIESGKVELEINTNDYIAFVRQQIIFNQILANNKLINIKLETEITTIKINFDKRYLSEVIDNLLSNAIKYSFQKTENIVKISKTENNELLTEVIDEGKGIPLKEQEQLFNYFQKTSTVPTKGEQSTGLGLAIAKKIVKLHNGTIGVKSIANKGSNFYFTLPL